MKRTSYLSSPLKDSITGCLLPDSREKHPLLKRTQEVNKPRLTVEIAGGLGNQLFMLYGGLYFSQYLDKELKYNTLDLGKISGSHPGLNIQGLGLLQTDEAENYLFAWLQKFLWKLRRFIQIDHIGRNFLASTFVTPEIGFISPHSVPPETRFLRGYFQSWKYFELLPEKPILNHECIPSPSDWFKKMKEEIGTNAPTVIHVRRGDYGLAENRSIGLLSVEYYRHALSILDVSKPIWVFSDSPEIVETELQSVKRELIFIKPPQESDPVESLLLMSLASEIVISNSTFSWWAAYLSGASTRILAPAKWYESQPDPVDLIPCNWERIESRWM
jgi:hypothetical protein